MDTRRKDSCSLINYLFLVSTIILMTECASFADTSTATETLAVTYKLGHNITQAEAESTVAGLERVLSGCQDNNLAFRIKYRIGVIYFKARMAEDAKSRFSNIVGNKDCPELIRVCSFNMIGQISRLKGKDTEALEAFNQLANLLEVRLAADKKNAVNPALMKLLCSALFSKAEIYQLQQDYTASISEYERLIRILGRNKKDQLSQYVSLANDRISQLYLKQGKIDRYIKISEALSTNYPEYYRTPIIKFEMEAVKFLKSASANLEFVNGSFVAPVQLIAYIKDSKGKISAQQITDTLGRLCKEQPDTYAGILLNYHYAWLLDALNQKDKAAEILARVSSRNIENVNNKPVSTAIIKIIAEYAKIQHAIMLGEKTDYRQALQVLGSLQTHLGQSHISDLAKSVSKSIETLKREVPKDENK